MTALALMRLTDHMAVSGSILLDATEITTLSEKTMTDLRGSRIAMIFQNPMSSLNPVKSIGKQISEVLRRHDGLSPLNARKQAIKLLDEVGIRDPDHSYHAFPHEFSGGMCQRVMIAMAIACRPSLLIADEPTTALDVTIQKQIMDLLASLTQRYRMSILFISHDLRLAHQYSDHMCVMYAGQIVESGLTRNVFSNPAHPYTRGLLDSIPLMEDEKKTFVGILGRVPDLGNLPPGCNFAPRCSRANDNCITAPIPLTPLSSGGTVRCLYPLGHKS
ncbi:oligopeptide transport ATP-binding protein OppD [Gluconobacter oxydans H24]|nr:oligopeptide transport ATP-binding protein OppD [Gluconobacter oxydans H24]